MAAAIRSRTSLLASPRSAWFRAKWTLSGRGFSGVLMAAGAVSSHFGQGGQRGNASAVCGLAAGAAGAAGGSAARTGTIAAATVDCDVSVTTGVAADETGAAAGAGSRTVAEAA